MKTARKLIKSLRSTGKFISSLLAPYVVLDDYGSMLFCWNEQEALNWMKYCSPRVMVWDRWNGILIASRIQDSTLRGYTD